MRDAFIVEWTYTPIDYFEEPTDITSEHAQIRLENGRAEAVVPIDDYPSDHSLRVLLHEDLDAMFLAAQVLSHKPYALSKSNVARQYADGRRDAFLFAEGASLKFSAGTADFITKDSLGRVVQDSRRNRIDKRKELASAAARFVSDAGANAILRSYSAAVNDPKNELIHLYEVRESLAKLFGGETAAIKAVGLSKSKWSRLGQLANDEPITQGRHRGKQLGALRDATDLELAEARGIVRAMVDGYFEYLDNLP